MFKLVCSLPGHILVNAVEAGLRLISAVAGYVEGKDAQGRGLLRRGSWNLDVLKWNKWNNGSFRGCVWSRPKKKMISWKLKDFHHNTKQSKTTTKTYDDCTCVQCSVMVLQSQRPAAFTSCFLWPFELIPLFLSSKLAFCESGGVGGVLGGALFTEYNFWRATQMPNVLKPREEHRANQHCCAIDTNSKCDYF